MLLGFTSVNFMFLPWSYLIGGIFYTNLLIIVAGLFTTICMFFLIDLRPKLGNSLREMVYKSWDANAVYLVDICLFMSYVNK